MSNDIWVITLPATVAALAWLYQKTWERHERRLAQYESIVDELPAFTVLQKDEDRIDRALSVHRRLWLIAPDDVVRAFEAFMDATRAGSSEEQRAIALGKFVISMRRDASFLSALVPRFRTTLRPEDFKMRLAIRTPASVSEKRP